MVRTRRKKEISKGNPVKSIAASSSTPQPSVAALLEKAQVLAAQCNYDLARKFATRVLERDSAHVEGRELLGVVELEDGNVEVAREVRQIRPGSSIALKLCLYADLPQPNTPIGESSKNASAHCIPVPGSAIRR